MPFLLQARPPWRDYSTYNLFMFGQDSSSRLWAYAGPDCMIVSSTSRAMIFVLSPQAGTLFRQSPPGTSCPLYSGDLTTTSWVFYLVDLLVIEENIHVQDQALWSLLFMSLTLELCSLRTVAGSTLDHTSHLFLVSRSGYCCSLIGSVLLFFPPDWLQTVHIPSFVVSVTCLYCHRYCTITDHTF